MATLRSRVASALSFAHLAGIGKANSAAAEEDDKRRDGESDEDYEKRTGKSAAGSGDDPKDQDRDNGDSQADDDKQREGESDEDYDKRMKSKATAAEDDEDKEKAEDDDDEEMRGNSAAAAARRRERARCAAIFASPAAARNPVLAANLAFATAMPRKEALALLEGTPAPAAATRERKNPDLGAGGEHNMTSSQKAQTGMVAALMKAAGRK